MIERLIELSIRNRHVVILLTAVVAVYGVWCLLQTPVDAIPDLSENQVIVFADWMGRSPQEIDDQITYPLSVNLQGLAGVRTIRSSSEFNFSMISVIFDDGVDFYFARQRVLEKLSVAKTFLPAGVVPYLAPDSTALGQIFWYTIEGEGYGLEVLRSLQDWYVRYQLYVPGVAEVAGVGGFAREYHIDIDPAKLRAYDISLGMVFDAVARSNVSVGGKVFVENGAEFLIRGVGWLRGVRDLESVVITQRGGVPIEVRNVASVQLGPEYRRSLLEKNGREAVGGVVLMRYGENPLAVTQAIKARIEQLSAGLPPGVKLVPFYDRTRLIESAIATLRETLYEELLVASLAVILILRHLRSALIICITLPLAVLVAFIFMYHLHIPSNIMSLSGIAISVGLFVDAAVVMVENTTHELTRRFGTARITGDITEVCIEACRLVGKPIFFAVTIMLVSFIPVFALGGIEGKMFHPLAWTKTLAMCGVALCAVTFVPAVIPVLVKGRLQREEDNWFVRSFVEIYKPVLAWLLDRPGAGLWFLALLVILAAGCIGGHGLFIGITAAALLLGAAAFRSWRGQGIALVTLLAAALWAWHLPKLGREFMPPLDEGSLLDMPVTVPRVSIAQAGDDIRTRDAVIRGFPEVELVVGKVGRADTPTDNAGIDMVESIVTLRPRPDWPKRMLKYDDAATECAEIIESLRKAGAFESPPPPEIINRIAGEATMDALFEFDARMRTICMSDEEALAGNAAAAKRLDALLDERAFAEMDRILLDTLPSHLLLRGMRLRDFDAAKREQIVKERAPLFAKQAMLWHKRKTDLTQELNSALQIPGWGNIWTQPIINRVDMLSTGVRTMIGVKVYGPRLADEPVAADGAAGRPGIQSVANEIAAVLRGIPGATDVFPDQVVGRSYLEIEVDREKAARFGVNVGDVQDAIEVAMGGKTVTTTVEGRRRFPVRVRYARDFWQTEAALRQILVAARVEPGSSPMASQMPRETLPEEVSGPRVAATPAVTQIPIADVTDIRRVEGPSVIKSENGILRAYVQLNVVDRDIVGFVEEAQKAVAARVPMPEGFHIEWGGQYEHQIRARDRLLLIFPLVVLAMFVILLMTFGDVRDALLIMLAVPGALAGGVIFQSLMGLNFSVAVWVGYIACFGEATQTGIVMLVYLHAAINAPGGLSGIQSLDQLRETVLAGAVHRLRPKLITEGVAIIGLMPMLWATGVGAEVMRPMAAPVLGGLLVADEVIDLLLPVLFNWYQSRAWLRQRQA